MKKTALAFALLIPVALFFLPEPTSGQDSGKAFQWLTDLQKARLKAKKTGKPLLVHFR